MLLDHRLITSPVPKTALPAWILWAVAGRKRGYFWRGWLPAGEGGGGKMSPNTTSDLRAALQGPTARDTNSAPASIQHRLSPRSALVSTPSLPAATKSPFPMNLAPCWLPPRQTGFLPAIPFHSHTQPGLATSASWATPHCPMPQLTAWTRCEGRHNPAQSAGLRGGVFREREAREPEEDRQSSHLNTRIRCHPPCWQLASANCNSQRNR